MNVRDNNVKRFEYRIESHSKRSPVRALSELNIKLK